ncbi:Lipocalin-like domain protein [Roseovarius albus]|uniref:Lipocalin-like domain protein n=1 Tax=Roseovarius albus TaxID=1247867 RepID=A0A1X7A0L4_9RHOB|nr:lipocalin family protein [Roseovarius albus]SLN66509.1 Lipocalin-like domain protein [Roseovarius albus]
MLVRHRLTTLLSCAGLSLMAACGDDATGFRDANVPLGVTTRGTTADVSGEWFVRATTPGNEDLQRVNILPERQGIPAVELVRRTCESNGDCEEVGEIWRAKPLGQHRWRIQSPQGDAARELWVVWVDEGFRTAAIGTPDGSYGWILDRAPTGGSDRVTAAQEILAFNGYDAAQLVTR